MSRKTTIGEVAEAFFEQHQNHYRYYRRVWFIWNGSGWEEERTLKVYADARDFARNAGLWVTASAVERIVKRLRVSVYESQPPQPANSPPLWGGR